ncbi:MAG: type II secretion system protein [Planctomycetota bacterium]
MTQPHDHPRKSPRRDAAFTLVELLIVVVILGVLASIVIPQFSDATATSKATAAASIVRTVQAKVFEDYTTRGDFPPTINADWFVEGSTPRNPLATAADAAVILYDGSATAAMDHPAAKTSSSSGAFWYNPTNGSFRALVPAQATQAETLELYNTANSAQLDTYAATSN